MGETIKIAGADGFEFAAYHEPAFTPRKGGVIVIQEIFGNRPPRPRRRRALGQDGL